MARKKSVWRVLICDGDADWIARLREIVENAGHEVVGEAQTASKALEVEEQTRPDVLITALYIPKPRDAFAMMAAIWAKERKVPRFFIVSSDERAVCFIHKVGHDLAIALPAALDG